MATTTPQKIKVENAEDIAGGSGYISRLLGAFMIASAMGGAGTLIATAIDDQSCVIAQTTAVQSNMSPQLAKQTFPTQAAKGCRFPSN